jgi:hypothetical protein
MRVPKSRNLKLKSRRLRHPESTNTNEYFDLPDGAG